MRCDACYQVDVYSAGVLLLEMLYPLATQMERVVVLSDLQRGTLPARMRQAHPQLVEFVLWLTSESPAARPTVDEVIAAPLLSMHGTLRIRAARRSMHELMQKVDVLVERAHHRVRSFLVQDGKDGRADEITIDYFIEPLEGAGQQEGAESQLRELRRELDTLRGVIEVRAFSQLESSPRNPPPPGPGGKTGSGSLPALQLPTSRVQPG
jgi:hypothetical protein